MKPLTIAPSNAPPPYPLLVGLHGKGYNTLEAAQQWACASQQGWLSTFPLAPHLVMCGKHWWDKHDENVRHVTHIEADLLPSERLGAKNELRR